MEKEIDFNLNRFESRKRDHIRHALDPSHQAAGWSGLDRIHLFHEALPEIDFEEINLESVCLGKPAPTPFYVAGMTAGHADASRINEILAHACEARGWAMGVGSQRRDLESSNVTIDRWKGFREQAPGLTLFANLGISQLITSSTSEVKRLVSMIEAQALVIHTNPLQEALQPEGTPRFKGALNALSRVCREIDVPVVLKETGCGFSKSTLTRLAETGLVAIDVSGLGGTHWGRIEGARASAKESGVQAAASEVFANWGESTVNSILVAREVMPAIEIWGSGGVRSGLDAAKLLAIGADRIGYAQPALQAALEGPEALQNWMEIQEYSLKVALFCTGCKTPNRLRLKEKAWKVSAI